MDSFSKFMDQIRADDGLKERTKAFTKSKLADEFASKNVYSKGSISISKSNAARKKILAAVFTLVALAAISTGGYALYNHPANYVSLDINPSVELGINVFDIVVQAEGINDEGKELIEADTMQGNAPLIDYVYALVSESARRGYISQRGLTVIAVAAESKREAKAEQLKGKSLQAIQSVLDSENLEAIIYADCADPGSWVKAKELGISSGKYRLLEILRSLDPSIVFTQYRNAEMYDLILKANDLMTSRNPSMQSVLSEKTAEQIKITVRRFQTVQGTMMQYQNMTQNNNEFDTENGLQQEQEQNRNHVQENTAVLQNSGTQTVTDDNPETDTITEPVETGGTGVTSNDSEKMENQESGMGNEEQSGSGKK